jgi:hypothetical protein
MQDRRQNDSFQREVLTSLGEIRVLCETNKCHNEAVTERVGKLEHASERQWWVSFVVTPIVIGLGHVARAFGVKI